MLVNDWCLLTGMYVVIFRSNEEWSGDSDRDRKNGPSEGEAPMYAGPAGMDPDGIIESNWEVVSRQLR